MTLSQSKAYSFTLFFIGALAFMPIMAVLVPRFLAYGPGAIGLLAALAYPLVFGARLSLSRPAFIMALGTLALAGLSSLWALDGGEALERTGKMALILLPGALLMSVACALPLENIKRVVYLLPLSLAITVTLLAFESSFSAPLYHLVHGLSLDTKINMSGLNRSIVVGITLFFSALAILPLIFRQNLWAGRVLFIALFLPFLFLTQCQSAQLAMIAGILAFVIFLCRFKILWGLLGGAIAVYFLTMPWIAMNGFEYLAATLDEMPFMGEGYGYAADRLEIWSFVSHYALQNPLYGFGIEATRAVEAFDTQMIYHKGNTILHPHNIALQLWIEFGLIGVSAALAMIGFLLWKMATVLSPAQARIALPSFIVVLSVASTGYGMWQGWWLGLLFLMASFVILAVRVTGDIMDNIEE